MAKKNVEENFDDAIVVDFDDGIVVEMTDADGNVFLYSEEMIIPVDGENFALLIAIHDDDEHFHDEECDCGCEDDEVIAIIAKIVVNENGEEEYIEPTDEEFERVQLADRKSVV